MQTFKGPIFKKHPSQDLDSSVNKKEISQLVCGDVSTIGGIIMLFSLTSELVDLFH